jgi:anaerobic selenocysteine-containing dehydrogenase
MRGPVAHMRIVMPGMTVNLAGVIPDNPGRVKPTRFFTDSECRQNPKGSTVHLSSPDRIVPTICGGCHDNCGMLVHVENNVIS